jgi:hypothetical protein
MIAKKKIVRRPRRRKTKRYFGRPAHDAIIKYQDEENIEKKNVIYVEEIFPAFSKLAENLIFIHGFAKNTNYEVLKSDCVSFLYESLHKFDHTRGTKAFSYFNVVAKNWLIIQSKKRTKHATRTVSLDDTDSMRAGDKAKLENYSYGAIQENIIINSQSIQELFSLMDEIKKRISTENEIACIDAIITLFRRVDDLDLLNKRAVFVYIRDISNLNPKQLSVAMSTIRKHYRELKGSGEFDILFMGE